MADDILIASGNHGGSWQIVLQHRDQSGPDAREVLMSFDDESGALAINANVRMNGTVYPAMTGNLVDDDFEVTGTSTFGDSIDVTGDAVVSGDVKAATFTVGANQVVGAQGAAVADVAGVGTADVGVGYVEAEMQAVQDLAAECKARLNEVIARLRAHGLIDT